MTVRISVGRWGSGKTAVEVMNIMEHHRRGYDRKIMSNIVPTDKKKLPMLMPLKKEMIFKEEVIGTAKDGSPKVKIVANKDYWHSKRDPVNIIIDEAHEFFDSRRSMSSYNLAFRDWLSMVRRWINRPDDQDGELVLITQRFLRLDTEVRELCHQIRHYMCDYVKMCVGCRSLFKESSEFPDKVKFCVRCGGISFKEFGHEVTIHYFSGVDSYNAWLIGGAKSFYKVDKVRHIERVFGLYDTLQLDNFL